MYEARLSQFVGRKTQLSDQIKRPRFPSSKGSSATSNFPSTGSKIITTSQGNKKSQSLSGSWWSKRVACFAPRDQKPKIMKEFGKTESWNVTEKREYLRVFAYLDEQSFGEFGIIFGKSLKGELATAGFFTDWLVGSTDWLLTLRFLVYIRWKTTQSCDSRF